MTTTAVYRIHNDVGELLYVGCSNRPERRIEQHKRDQAWASEIATVTLESFATRDLALAAEMRAIQTEGPRYNVAGLQEATDWYSFFMRLERDKLKRIRLRAIDSGATSTAEHIRKLIDDDLAKAEKKR